MTEFFDWSCRHFAQPLMRLSEEQDPESSSHHRREFRFLRNNNVRQEAREEQIRAGMWKVIYCQECEDSLLGSDVNTCAVYTPIKREALCSKETHAHKHYQFFMWWTEGKYLKDIRRIFWFWLKESIMNYLYSKYKLESLCNKGKLVRKATLTNQQIFKHWYLIISL